MSIDPTSLQQQHDIIENIEKSSARMVCQAVWDFVAVARETFALAKDLAGTVGEDITRDAMETMGVSRIPTARLIGQIDYKRARYYFDPAYSVRQALFVDSKAEKSDDTSVTIQTAQTSMQIRLVQAGIEVDEPGKLDQVLAVGEDKYLATTIFVKYLYEVLPDGDNRLMSIFVVSLPNGMLQDHYNPTATDTIWRVGRHSPKRGEDFRVRIAFNRLKSKRSWRVQRIQVHPEASFAWNE
jgi:Type II restriction enzyme SfiI